MLGEVVGRLTWKEVGGDTMENASDHHGGNHGLAEKLTEGGCSLSNDRTALGAFEDVIVGFV